VSRGQSPCTVLSRSITLRGEVVLSCPFRLVGTAGTPTLGHVWQEPGQARGAAEWRFGSATAVIQAGGGSSAEQVFPTGISGDFPTMTIQEPSTAAQTVVDGHAHALRLFDERRFALRCYLTHRQRRRCGGNPCSRGIQLCDYLPILEAVAAGL